MENEKQTQSALEYTQSLLASYQTESKTNNRKTRDEILAKYFVPRNVKEIFRILPPKAGKKPIEEAFFHVVTTNASGGVKKHGTVIYCPAHNDPKVQKLDTNGQPMVDSAGSPIMVPAPCPLCARHKALIGKQDQSIKYTKKENLTEEQKPIKEANDLIYKEAIKWEAKKFYILRGIDKGKDKDGVKFWRFKHNYKKQGVLDKLVPALQIFGEEHKQAFFDVNNGCDLNITMADTEFNGKVYKAISAITPKMPSKLSTDPVVAKQWENDPIGWRDVFVAKKAPNITPYEFLVLTAQGNNPYWDDSDQNNKHWVFPGRPDLEEAANNRNRNLDADDDNEAYEMASDLDTEYVYSPSVSEMKPEMVGTFKDDAVEITADLKPTQQTTEPAPVVDETNGGEFDDLPF
jgi:hypothetical protein